MSVYADRSAKLPLRVAMEARDLSAAVNAFAPDAVLRSPFTSRLAFQGREQILAITEIVLEVLEDLHYTNELHGTDSAVLVATARVGGQEIEMVDHLHLDESGKITELTVFFRPLPAIAVAMRVIATRLGQRKSTGRARTLSLLTSPLGPITDMGDRVGARLVGPTL